jgi:predicted RNase H-like nuclease (RuvC/YqgF family)
MAAIGSDPAALLFVVAVAALIVALLGVVVAWRAWRRERHDADHMAPEKADLVAIGRWVEEGRKLFGLWQERVERLNELQGRLAAMAEEIGQLKTQLRHMDELQTENRRLTHETEALLLEREHLRTVLARIGELIQRASEARPGPAGEAAPGVGP